MSIDPHHLKKLLVVRADRMGDVVITTPVFPAIKHQFPKIHLAVLVDRAYGAFIEGNPYVDELLVYDKQGTEKSLWGAYTFIRRLEAKTFDAAILFHPRNRMSWTAFLAHIPIRVGYRAKNFALLTHSIPYNKPAGEKHEAEYNFELLRLLGIQEPRVKEPFIPFCDVYRDKLDVLLDTRMKYVVFNPSASTPSKIWPAAYFAQVADYIYEKHQATPVMIGSKSDLPFSQAMSQKMKSRAIDLTGKLDVGSLAWLFRRARLFVSNDTGPVHVAAAVNTPVVSIFLRNLPGLGPTRWRPLGFNGHYLLEDLVKTAAFANHGKIEESMLKSLTPGAVIRLIEEKKWLESYGAKTE